MTSETDMKRYFGGMTQRGLLALLGIIVLYSIAVVSPFFIIYDNIFSLLVRIFALAGMASLLVASMLSIHLRAIREHFNRPYMSIHHVFAALGLIFITAHPVVFAIYTASISIFIPDFSSWYAFWSLAGRPALYIVYIAVLAAIMRMRIRKTWKYFHQLIYIALIFAYIHGLLIGADFANPLITILFGLLLGYSLGVYIIKRIR